MERTETQFRIKFQNIPIINLREEFKNFHRLLSTEEFKKRIWHSRSPIHTPYLIWLGRYGDFLTLLLQRAIMGIEAYLPNAVLNELAKIQPLTEQTVHQIQNPFQLGGKGTADNYYNRLPAMVNEDFSLRVCKPELWEKTRQFYTGVRNPLFHGQQIHKTEPVAVLQVFDYIADLYAWIDGWHSLDEVINGASAALKVRAT